MCVSRFGSCPDEPRRLRIDAHSLFARSDYLPASSHRPLCSTGAGVYPLGKPLQIRLIVFPWQLQPGEKPSQMFPGGGKHWPAAEHPSTTL
jgi:hypothetical protein